MNITLPWVAHAKRKGRAFRGIYPDSPSGNAVKLSRYTVLFELCYLPASETEEQPLGKKNNFAQWCISGCRFSRFGS
jgi:hypothetical protein